MNSQHAKNCNELRKRFEGSEAIYLEHGAIRVRVSDIRARGFGISAQAEEIVTPGLGVGGFFRVHKGDERPRRWRFGGGYLMTFSEQTWKMGYGGWSLYFDPRSVGAVMEFAAQLAADGNPHVAYGQVCKLLQGRREDEAHRFVFPDAVEKGTGRFRMSDQPAVVVKATSGWVECPYCDRRFMVTDERRWDGERHLTCGQRIIVGAAS